MLFLNAIPSMAGSSILLSSPRRSEMICVTSFHFPLSPQGGMRENLRHRVPHELSGSECRSGIVPQLYTGCVYTQLAVIRSEPGLGAL